MDYTLFSFPPGLETCIILFSHLYSLLYRFASPTWRSWNWYVQPAVDGRLKPPLKRRCIFFHYPMHPWSASYHKSPPLRLKLLRPSSVTLTAWPFHSLIFSFVKVFIHRVLYYLTAYGSTSVVLTTPSALYPFASSGGTFPDLRSGHRPFISLFAFTRNATERTHLHTIHPLASFHLSPYVCHIIFTAFWFLHQFS